MSVSGFRSNFLAFDNRSIASEFGCRGVDNEQKETSAFENSLSERKGASRAVSWIDLTSFQMFG